MSELHIKRPINPRFIARVRQRGCRRYQVVGRYRTMEAAGRAMLKAFMGLHAFKRGDVLMIEDWYEPNMLMEITR